METRVLSFFAVSIGLFASLPAIADTVTFDFLALHPVTGDMGVSSFGFTSGGRTLTASGYYTPSNAAQHLYIKNGGTGESGLGLIADSADHEVEAIDFIQLDLSSLIAAGYTNFTITLGSLQSGEGGKITFSGTGGTLTGGIGGTTLTGGALIQTWAFTDTSYSFVDITGTGVSGGDVILASVTATSVPDESRTAIMLVPALLALALFRARRRCR